MYRILLIDDDDELCTELGQILEDEGYEVLPCSNSTDGKHYILNYSYDLVILDLKMVGFTGYDLLPMVKEKAPTPVIILTGRPLKQIGLDESQKEVIQYEEEILKMADIVLNKPVKIPSLIEQVKKTIG